MQRNLIVAVLGLALPAWVSAATITYTGWSDPVAGYGDLPLARYINAPTGVGTIVLQAGAGQQVELTRYDIAGWTGDGKPATNTLTLLIIQDENNNELSNYPLYLTATATSPFFHFTDPVGAVGSTLTITFTDQDNGRPGYIGIANVQYVEVAVPEPSSIGVLWLAGTILGRRRRA